MKHYSRNPDPNDVAAGRRAGTVLGLAWGDALGCPVETWSAAEIRSVWGDYRTLPERYPIDALARIDARKVARLRPLGLHSDDTQQALALINVVLEGWSTERWAHWLTEGSKRGAWRGTGHNFDAAVRALISGRHPVQCGSPSAGIGAAMRIAPIATLLSGEELMRVSIESSRVTHADHRACAMAYAVAKTASELIRDEAIDTVRQELPDQVAVAEQRWFPHDPPVVSTALRELMPKVDTNPFELRQLIVEHARPHLDPGKTPPAANQAFALLGGMHAVLMALRTDADPTETLAQVVQQGDDTDTVAAICGALLGARFGADWIPDYRLLDGPRLHGYAYPTQGQRETLDQFMAAETAWTLVEKQFTVEGL